MSLQDPEFDKFKIAFHQERYDDALASLNKLLRVHPTSFALRWHYARVLDKLERFDEARTVVEGVLQLRPDFVPALILQVHLDMYDQHQNDELSDEQLEAQEKSQFENIELRLRKILRMDPNAVDALQLLSAVLRNKTDEQSTTEAYELMDRALQLAPGRIDLLEDRANTFTASAMVSGDEAESVDTVTTLSGITYSRNLLEAALADFKRCYELSEQHRYGLRVASILHDLGRYDEALVAYDTVLERVPEDDPHRHFIIERRARSENNGAGEREQMAKMLEATINSTTDRTQEENAAAHMILSAANAVRDGKSVSDAMESFADLNDPDSLQATRIATQIYNMVHEPAPGLVAVDAKNYPGYQREFAAQCNRELTSLGMEHIADAEAEGLKLMLGQSVLLGIFRDETGEIGVATYAMRQKKTGWLNTLILFFKGQLKTHTLVECITQFNSGENYTTQYENISSFEYGPPIYIEKMPKQTPLAELINRHKERIEEHKQTYPHSIALRALDLQGVEDRWVANQKTKREYRESIGYATDAELRKLLGAHYERLGDKVKAKLKQLSAA